jgi:exodeoxyribonuclease V gamma subunit
MLKVVQSNRVENLAAELLGTQAEAPLADPLAEEVVVVQSPGMALWLRTEQAKTFGIAAGVAYPLPSLFAWRLLRALVPAPVDDPYAKRSLRWTLFGLLAALPPEAPEFAPLRHYLDGGEQALKRFQLAERIADLFDQYLVYRPSWLAAWGRGQRLGLPGPHEAWQSALWAQAVAALGAVPDRAALMTAALQRLEESPPGSLDHLLAPVAPRVALFGLSALPPGQLALLTALARHCPVTLYFLNPSADYWAEVLRPAVVARRQAQALQGGGSDALEAYEAAALTYLPAHPLLAQNGALGRQFLNQLLALDGAAEVLDHFGEPEGTSALAELQRAVLLGDDAPLLLDPDDRSLRFMPCPSPLREIEALYDALVDAFEADATLRPQDVVVMIPDIDHYAPLIEAVFGRPDLPLALPFSIADRQGQQEAPLLAWLGRLLSLPATRFERSAVLGLLALPQCQRAFKLTPDDLSLGERWLEAAEVRWGWDGEDWAATGLAEEAVIHSWRRGLDRLILGAMTGEAEGVFSGLAPVSLAEGEGARLSALLSAVETLASFRARLAGPSLPAQWAATLEAALQVCLELAPDDELVLAPFREALAELLTVPEAVAATPLPRLALLEALKPALEGPGAPHRFFAGGVTFCTLMPMRVLPFRVVCLVGMSEGAYPRLEQPLPFDLMAPAPRPGDRLRRSEDRYLFLEALLSARDRVLVSWTARDRSYRLLPPSLVVTELQTALTGEGDSEALEKALAPVTVAPPLQPFSSRYGTGGLETYQGLWRPSPAAAEASAPPARVAAPPPAPEEPRAPALLLAFFRDPPGTFLREALGAALRRLPEGVEDDEPFTLDALGRYRLLADSVALDGEAAVLRARGLLPLGAAGDAALERALAITDALRGALPEAFWAATATQAPVDLTLPSGRLLGPCLRWSDGLVRGQRFGALRAQDRLALWVQVLLSAAMGWGRHGVLLGPEKASLVTAPEAPKRALEALLARVHEGLAEPLPLFPEASCAWAEAVHAGKADDDAFARVVGKWRPERSEGAAPEGLTLPARHAFPWGLGPVRERFCALAEAVFLPLLETEEVVALGAVAERLRSRGALL